MSDNICNLDALRQRARIRSADHDRLGKPCDVQQPVLAWPATPKRPVTPALLGRMTLRGERLTASTARAEKVRISVALSSGHLPYLIGSSGPMQSDRRF